ncbi:family 78 glycoside hydrolase catalytic domain [Streptomyces sp. NPDC091292]|uniref:family 78 glycoside hydrolase catalytic domain n=1 Tax=Streptomyces sp. NPDC091292 TaxID=3365991 RepID=UPI0037FE0B26
MTLRHPDATPLPPWRPGAHIDLLLDGGTVRHYSLCGDLQDRSAWRIGVLRVPDSRGGSAHVHTELRTGTRVRVRGPRNTFLLRPAGRYLFVAGGIGITPLLPMVAAAQAAAAEWSLLYGGRTRSSMAFLDELAAYGDQVAVRPQDRHGLLDLDGHLGEPDADTLIYACGPEPLLTAVENATRSWPSGALRVERFQAGNQAPPTGADAFDVVLARAGLTALAAPAAAGDTAVKVSGVAGYHVGGTINIDTGDGGGRLETREITAIGTAGAEGTGIAFAGALKKAHASGATVTGSGNPLASTDPSAGAAVAPRMIARLEITDADGTVHSVVSDRAWSTALGPTTTTNWFSGSDYDARREQDGWTSPGADLGRSARRRDGSPVGWVGAGIAPPPNLTTELVWRAGEPVKVMDRIRPVAITQPKPGVWVFDFGQNFAGWPELSVDGTVPPGTTIKLLPAESLAADGTVDQASVMGGGGSRGTDVFAAYTTYGDRKGETWHPRFHYFGMQWVQVTGLPPGYRPTAATVTGLQLHADTPVAGSFHTSNERINRIHRMARYSIMSNTMSTFTDCPGREKLAYPADYLQPFGSLHRHFGYAAYLRTMQRHLAEGQSKAGDNIGNVALKAPVYDWGYTGRFGDEINWGNGIVLTPWFLYETYGDTQTMARYYPQMQAFMDYIRVRKAGTGANAYLVDAALADWIVADTTSGRITGTWGYHQIADRMARMAAVLGRTADASAYRALASHIKDAFNDAFYNTALGRYTSQGNQGTTGATQAAQALALDEGLVPERERQRVLDALVELVEDFRPFGGGPHFSGGTIGLAPTVRALLDGGRDDVLWRVLRFHGGLAGIRQARGSAGYRELVIDPRVVGDLTQVEGSYRTPYGHVTAEWTLKKGVFRLKVDVPPNTTAEVRLPKGNRTSREASDGAVLRRAEGDRAVYGVPSGTHTFTVRDVRAAS